MCIQDILWNNTTIIPYWQIANVQGVSKYHDCFYEGLIKMAHLQKRKEIEL
jgi:hypothetical protein